MDIWSWIENHETLTVGVFGFIGVMITLWFNAWLARQQRRNERHYDRQTLRAALSEELKIHLESLVKNNASIEEGGNQPAGEAGAFVPTDNMDDAYRAFTDRIGILSQQEVRKIMYAYLSLRTYYAKLFLVGVPATTGDHHVHVPAKNLPMLQAMERNMIPNIEEAIKVIKRATEAA